MFSSVLAFSTIVYLEGVRLEPKLRPLQEPLDQLFEVRAPLTTGLVLFITMTSTTTSTSSTNHTTKVWKCMPWESLGPLQGNVEHPGIIGNKVRIKRKGPDIPLLKAVFDTKVNIGKDVL